MGPLVMAKPKRGREQMLEESTVEADEHALLSKVSKSKRKQQSEVVQDLRAEDISKTKKTKKKKKKKKLRSETLQLHVVDALLDSTEHPDALDESIDLLEDARSNAKTSKQSRDDNSTVVNAELSEKAEGYGTKRKKVKQKRDKWGQVLSNAGNAQDALEDDDLLASVETATNEHFNGDSVTNHERSGQYDHKTVCAGGMPYDTTETDIQTFFKNCGAIAKVVCMKFADTQRFKGLAFITFKTEAAATKALSLDGANMDGRLLKIEKARAGGKVLRPLPEREPGSLSVYIGNLIWDVQKADIKRFFKGCDIDDVRLAVDKHTGDFRGYGHVDFSNEKSLERAIKMDQRLLLGRAVKVCYAVSKGSKGSARF